MICGEGIQETLIRECAEEASIPEELACTATSAGCVRYSTPVDHLHLHICMHSLLMVHSLAWCLNGFETPL